MKQGFKQLFVLAVSSILFVNANAQSESRSFSKGDNVLTVGYGMPNLGKSIFKLVSEFSDAKVKGLGPVHLKYEHAVSDRIGLGISAGYVSFGGEYDVEDSYSGDTYRNKLMVTRLGVLARFNCHFSNSEKFDPYFGFGAGYNYFNTKYTFDENDPNKDEISFNIPINVAFEGSIGARYYFSKNIGAYMEVGFGKSLVQAGLAARF